MAKRKKSAKVGRCDVCKSRFTKMINEKIVAGEDSLAAIARVYNVEYTALLYHKKHHLEGLSPSTGKKPLLDKDKPPPTPPKLRTQRLLFADDLVGAMREVRTKLLAIEETAKNDDNLPVLLGVMDRTIKAIETQARLIGKIQDSTVNVLISNPTFISIQTKILQALEPYPEARLAVVSALQEEVESIQSVTPNIFAVTRDAQADPNNLYDMPAESDQSSQVIDIVDV